MSLRHQDIEGIIANFSDRINEFRINTDLKATDKFKIGVDINLRSSESRQPTEPQIYHYLMHNSKFAYPKYPDGSYGLSSQLVNPLMQAEKSGINRAVTDYVFGSIKGDYEIVKGLVFSTQYALRYNGTSVTTFINKFSNRDSVTNRVFTAPLNSLSEERGVSKEYTLNSLLTYNKNFGKHETNTLLGYSTINFDGNNISGFRQDFYNNLLRTLSQGSSNNMNSNGSNSKWGLRSYFGRINYNFDNRYLFESNARLDGSSRFSEKKRYSFFPSFSAGWRMSEEEFWSALKPTINDFKLRASTGQTGNQAVGLYSYFETLSAVTYTLGNSPVQGYTQGTLANTNLTWETTRQTDIGFDMAMFGNKLNVTFDVYNKRTEGILLNLPIPGTIGLNAPPQNAGSVENKGYEIALNYRGGGQLKYNVGVNFSDNRNKVLSLAGTGPYITGNPTLELRTVIKEGLPMNSMWGYLTDGYFQTPQEVSSYPTLVPNTKPGDIKYLDLNKDGIVNTLDNVNLGNSFPRYTYGMAGNLAFKNLDLFMQWQGAAGYNVVLVNAFQHMTTFEAFTHKIYTDNYWTPERPNARFPRPIKRDTRNFQTSDRTMIKGDYLRLKNLVLTYNVPENISRRALLSRAAVYVSATNLLTFSRLNEWQLDAEMVSGRGNYYPQVRMYAFGVNIKL